MLATWGTSTGRNPTLDLQFAGATSLDNRITFSRGSQATLFDSTGALVYAKHNLLLQSQTFDAAYWAKNNGATVTADAGAAPDGTTTADQFNGAALTSTGVFTFPTGIQSNVAYTFSVYIKNVSAATTLLIGCDTNPSNAKVTFNAATGAITAAGANVTSSAVIDMGNGWYRVIVRFTTTSTAPAFVIYSDSGALATWLTWGAQLNLTAMEGGVTSSLSTYYPTVASAYYAPRFDYNPSTLAAQGLLIEEQRTNSIRNNTMQGAVAGTPGTVPTNWSINNGGLSINVIGTGTENGVTYIDLQFTGTPTGGSANARFEPNTQIVAANGQTWTGSFYARQVGGTTNNILDVNQTVFFRDGAGGILTQQNTTLTNLSATAIARNRQTCTFTAANASTAFVNNGVQLTLTIGVGPVDITLRIGLPQLEQGAFATSVIPTTTTALTRNADVASMTGTNFSSWYNQTEGTIVAQALSAWASGNVVGSSDGTNNNRIFVGTASGPNGRLLITTSAVTQASITSAYSLSTTAKFAGAYKLNSSNFALNGALGTEDTACTIPTVDRLSIGSNTTLNDFFLNGYIQRISFYPVRLPNSTLQALTA